MTAAGGMLTGASCALAGFRWIARPGLRRWVAAPLAISLVVVGGGMWWLFGVIGAQAQAAAEAASAWLPAWLAWGAGAVEWLVWLLAVIPALLLGAAGFGVLANVVGAPFNARLAAEVARACGRPPPAGPTDLRGLVKAPWEETRKLLYLGVRALPFLLLFVIPGLQVAAPFLWLLYAGWASAFEHLDYPLSNEGMGVDEIRDVLRRHRAAAWGFGLVAYGLYALPLVNIVAMPAGVAGAALLWSRHLAGAGASPA
ncbi:sulfate transporter CysZ [Inmirania thermothiophila]|uniref:CysZ protein n=1 Tax=Inmirania thermothiophila TaxID=1750597 RepID=A0A3N1Y0J1_9GAMM|nr:sulfate transporter CysZ [Inmirania thermothiophila]ROR32353.1 CysZ protein [Inmirania thermothiophila]